VRLYRIVNGSGTLEADTHEGLGDMAPLDTREAHKGMHAVLTTVTQMIHGFHDKPPETIEGARMIDLTKRIPTIRVYVSSHGGRTVLQVPYTPEGDKEWKAFLTIQRDDWQEAPALANPSPRVAQTG